MSARKPNDAEPPTSSPDLSWLGKSVVSDSDSSVKVGEGLRLRDVAGVETPRPKFKPTGKRYEVESLVGEGGMGTVYLAYDHHLERRVALKVLNPRPGMAEHMMKRFREEAEATAQLEHPNIVPIYDIGRAEDGRHFYTMRYIKGTSLEDVLRGLKRVKDGHAEDPAVRRSWSLVRMLQTIQQVAMAIDFANYKGVIHRDLKPSNVMLGEFGEVVVMDWGLARVMKRPDWPEKLLVGTPAYMSPEQAAGRPADERSDIFSLGVVFYRMLTLELPFGERELKALLEKIRSEEPPSPRKHNPRVPEPLEKVCLKAMAKNPELRFKRAREFHDAIVAYLEGFKKQSVRQGVAREEASEGASWVRRYHDKQSTLVTAERRLREATLSTPGWAPLEDKKPMLDLSLEVEQLTDEMELAFGHAVDHLSKALGADPGHRDARVALADLYYERFLEAERSGDHAQAQSARRLVLAYHEGRYARELAGAGELSLDSQPSGALVALYRYEEIGLVLEPVWQEQLGRTPLKVDLPMGSYLLIIEAPGYAPVHYPVFIGRLDKWRGRVRLYTPDQIGQGFIYVPAGPFIQGGDRATSTSLPRARPFVEDYFIAETPVTGLEYLAFLNDLALSDPEEALQRVPRRGPEEGAYWRRGEDGRFHPPEVDQEGDRHDLNWPALAISWYDAVAFARWRSERDGRAYGLPSEEQWEKAARGVDGRFFPWGNRFDAALSNMSDSRERAGPLPAGSLKLDVSPYGVRGMAGNVEEWCRDPWGDSRGSYVARGGSWKANAVQVRCAYRVGIEPHLVAGIRGFRLVSNKPARK